MKYVYILENETKFREEMIQAIRKIDPKLSVHCFDSLENFAQWIRLVMYEGPAALAKGGIAAEGNPAEASSSPDILTLVITKNEFLGAKHLGLLRKTRDLFINKKLCTAEDPTSLVITSFENPDFDIKLVEDRIINNVIFKPFDKLILEQHLSFAVGGRHIPSQYPIQNIKTTATIEMLKEVELEAVSDVGFISQSNRPIAPGSFGKYYSPSFISVKDRSMMAVCLQCDPHPVNPSLFRCSFSFFGADAHQITNIRKEVRQKDAKLISYPWIPNALPSIRSQKKHVAIVTLDEELAQHMKHTLESRFENLQVHIYHSLQLLIFSVDREAAKKDKLLDVSKFPRPPDHFEAIFADNTFFEENFKERWQTILDTIRKNSKPAQTRSGKIDLFVIAKKPYADHEERALGEVALDIFFTPLDPVYLTRKLCVFIPGLRTTEALEYPTLENKHIAKVASPIQISEFSEAGLVLKYYRAISVGSFREFVLWLPHELEIPEFLANANYHEESKTEKGVYLNHFVFFGMNDHFLMHIRRWILQNHVHNKESEAG
jgi:hypothetical protein